MQGKIWKFVSKNNRYIVSDFGEVFSCASRKKLKPIPSPLGYKYVVLYDNRERKRYTIHRLVAEAFVPNLHNKKEINHKNGIKDDNRADNLEWVTRSENMKHSFVVLGRKPSGNGGKVGRDNSSSKVVLQILNGDVIGRFFGCCEASRKTGVCRQSISSCCLGRYRTAGGFEWKFEG